LPDRIALGIVKNGLSLGSNGGFPLDTSLPVTRLPQDSPIVRDINSTFTLRGFERSREPLRVGTATLDQLPNGIEFYALPIKFPSSEYRVPIELAAIECILNECASFEHAINPRIDEYYGYLSICKSYVRAGDRQLTSGLHSDGIQGPRIDPKVAIDHGYQVSDSDPTEFFPRPVDMSGIDVNRHSLDAVFEMRVDTAHPLVYPVGTIVMFDAYCVHRAVPAKKSGWRALVKLAYSVRQYDRNGNAINTLFEEDYLSQGWQFQNRPFPPDLERPSPP
jgi:hypothetical protein